MELEEEIRRRLDSFREVRFALLFGSCCSGSWRRDSDLDVAVFVDEALSPRERFVLRLRLGNELLDLGRPDVTILNDAPPLLGQRALMGRKIMVRDAKSYVRFFVRTVGAAADESHFRRLHRRMRERRIREGLFGRP